MCWLAVNGTNTLCENDKEKEFIFDEKPIRWIEGSGQQTNWEKWTVNDEDTMYVELPKGSIEKLIGKSISWKDEPYELI